MNLPKVRAWCCLSATVLFEVLATLMLKAADGFTVLVPSIVSVAAYGATVVLLAFALKEIPMSVAYVIWTGAGTAGVALLGVVLFAERLSPAAWVGVALVAGGVMLVNASGASGKWSGGACGAHAAVRGVVVGHHSSAMPPSSALRPIHVGRHNHHHISQTHH